MLSKYDWEAEGQRCEGITISPPESGATVNSAADSSPPFSSTQQQDTAQPIISSTDTSAPLISPSSSAECDAAQHRQHAREINSFTGDEGCTGGAYLHRGGVSEGAAQGVEGDGGFTPAGVIRQQVLMQELHSNGSLPHMTYRCGTIIIRAFESKPCREGCAQPRGTSRKAAYFMKNKLSPHNAQSEDDVIALITIPYAQ